MTPILEDAAFCKYRHMGFACFVEHPRNGSHIHPSALVTDKEALLMAIFRPLILRQTLGATDEEAEPNCLRNRSYQRWWMWILTSQGRVTVFFAPVMTERREE